MSKCCGQAGKDKGPAEPCSQPISSCCGGGQTATPDACCPSSWFANMIPNCLAYASAAKAQGQSVVGIMCEYTPREIIMAAGAVPVCLCGGSAETIPAAEEHLPANLCPLIKSTYGYHVRKSNPFLEMADLIVAETTCDGKKKMYELMGQTRPMVVLELPQKPDDPDALQHWRRELVKLKQDLERRFKTEITDCKLRQAIRAMNRERSLRRELAALMAADPPPMSGRQLLDFKSSIAAIPADLEQYERAIDHFGNNGNDPSLSGRTRVLMTGVPMAHGAERVLEIVETRGGLVVCMESCVGLKPILDDVDETTPDPLDALAEKYIHLPCSVMTINDRRLSSLRELAARYRPHCVIEIVWQACLTYDVESARIKQFVEKELGLPHLRIETDYSSSDSGRIAVRVEALFETIRDAAGRGACGT
ncbi:MAG: 2-hydroxyacyl-CoA dehydratase [Phycisphaerae bacterium]|nr:2-hydroxyacyl-CoA dehydratase [Phycisphaerae bacterium]